MSATTRATTSEGFCQRSKYLERLLDGITLLRKKEGFADLDLKSMSIERADTISARVKAELLPIRGSAGKYAQMTDEERFRAASELPGRSTAPAPCPRSPRCCAGW